MPIKSTLAALTPTHDHRRCVAAAMSQAEAVCRRQRARLTPIRRRVLELIWAGHQPLPAYQILQQLRGEKHNAEPPTVYRALDFLQRHRLVHKIESLNAYVGCAHPQQQHPGQFLICQQCNQVAEINDPKLQTLLATTAAGAGLEATHQTVEISGLCVRCRHA